MIDEVVECQKRRNDERQENETALPLGGVSGEER